jgi:hypothetical protein
VRAADLVKIGISRAMEQRIVGAILEGFFDDRPVSRIKRAVGIRHQHFI